MSPRSLLEGISWQVAEREGSVLVSIAAPYVQKDVNISDNISFNRYSKHSKVAGHKEKLKEVS